jgi:hypothetical protein
MIWCASAGISDFVLKLFTITDGSFNCFALVTSCFVILQRDVCFLTLGRAWQTPAGIPVIAFTTVHPTTSFCKPAARQ